jgi:hypothetical protein
LRSVIDPFERLRTLIKAKIFTTLALLICFLVSPRQAGAVSLGDAALTVAVTTAAGGVLGASTLPFYAESGKHTKNIFYGAALGAVVGVFLAAYAGVEEGAVEEEEAFRAPRKQEPTMAAYWPLESKLGTESKSVSTGLPRGEISPLIVSSISLVSF